MFFKKKPLRVEGLQFLDTAESVDKILDMMSAANPALAENARWGHGLLNLNLYNVYRYANPGDWIVKDDDNLFSVWSQNRFLKSHDRVITVEHSPVAEALRINADIQSSGADTNMISGGNHTFDQLYAYCVAMWVNLCGSISKQASGPYVWRSREYADGRAVEPGWFMLGMNKEPESQITYCVPESEWPNCEFADTLDKAPEWDGHTSNDVLLRLKKL
jgi:hypothetical protein